MQEAMRLARGDYYMQWCACYLWCWCWCHIKWWCH